MKPSVFRLLDSESHWSGDDIAVAEILLELVELIPAHDSSEIPITWGAKRRRSVTSRSQFPAEQAPLAAIFSGESAKKRNAAVSPVTPLMFSPSESDGQTQSRVSVSKRKNKDELVQNFTFLTHQKDSLLKEMEAVKRHLDNLKASNVELKNRKQVIIYGMGQPALHTLHHRHHHFHNQKQAFQLQQFPAIQWCSFPASSQLTATPSSAMIAGNRSKMGPVILPDLNLSLEEAVNVEGYQPSDAMTMITSYSMNRAWASAQARKRRMHIYKAKNILRQR
uniref:Uncharacterized protein n=1 Tax=Kalanchoe fedtschenkoi TaxID=63787 RepID=A0A7N0U386_KALFE